MNAQYNYIAAVLSDEIVIYCATSDKKKLLKTLGAKSKIFNHQTWYLKYKKNDENDLGCMLTKLRDFGFCFAGSAGGWPPAAIFEHLREKRLVTGKIIEILWRAPNKAITIER